MSPSLINPALRIASEIKYVKNAGAMICMTSIMTITVTAEVPPVVIVLYVIIGPTNPAVPIPEPIALFVIFKTDFYRWIVRNGNRIICNIDHWNDFRTSRNDHRRRYRKYDRYGCIDC